MNFFFMKAIHWMDFLLHITHKNVPKICNMDASFLDLMLVKQTHTKTKVAVWVDTTHNKKICTHIFVMRLLKRNKSVLYHKNYTSNSNDFFVLLKHFRPDTLEQNSKKILTLWPTILCCIEFTRTIVTIFVIVEIIFWKKDIKYLPKLKTNHVNFRPFQCRDSPPPPIPFCYFGINLNKTYTKWKSKTFPTFWYIYHLDPCQNSQDSEVFVWSHDSSVSRLLSQ